MTRTTAAKAGALDLLDRLYRNQLLVHFAMDHVELGWLREITSSVDAAVKDLGVSELRSARLTHRALAILEIYLADDFEAFEQHMKQLEVKPAWDADPTLIGRVCRHRQNYFAGFVVAVGNLSSDPGDGDAALAIALDLVDTCRAAPPAVRHRLVERSFAYAFPQAPIQLFAWLAGHGLIPSAKFGTSRRALDPDVALTARAGSLCELEMLRACAQEQMRQEEGVPDRGFADHVRRAVPRHMSDAAHASLCKVAQAIESRRLVPHEQRKFAFMLDGRWKESDYLRIFFAHSHLMAPYARALVEKQSTALTDMGAAEIALRKASTDRSKALYGFRKDDQASLAEDVSIALQRLGFDVNARTLYRHLVERVSRQMTAVANGLAFQRHVGIVYPAEYDDVYHCYQVALTT